MELRAAPWCMLVRGWFDDGAVVPCYRHVPGMDDGQCGTGIRTFPLAVLSSFLWVFLHAKAPSHVGGSLGQSDPAVGMKGRGCWETGSLRSFCNAGCLNKFHKG